MRSSKLWQIITFSAGVLCGLIATNRDAQAQQLQIGINPLNFGVYVWRQTQAYRSAQGQPGITFPYAPVNNAAQKYAEYQARTNTTGHNADGRDPGARIAAENVQACYWAENVYEQWNSPSMASWQNAADGAMNFWRNSPGHAANMRDPESEISPGGCRRVEAWGPQLLQGSSGFL